MNSSIQAENSDGNWPEVTQAVRLERLPAEEKLPLITSAEYTHAPAWLHSVDALRAML